MRTVVALLAAATAFGAVVSDKEEGDLWAVLVAGSNTWDNYRHQADVCHAYQILHAHGVPDEHIIVFMYDDIANNPANPTPGVVINRPNGPNVYPGVPKDYTGKEVTPENFLKVLRGDSEGMKGVGSGKVLKSGPNDRVFINLVDHGASGIFAFPTSYLHVKEFTNGIKQMSRNKQFKDMVIYMEACESGSMFKSLPDDISVYAVSAANATQSSYACYWDSKLETFLGDVFSIKWMEDTDREVVNKETLEKQYHIVERETTQSHVMQFGELSLTKMTVSEFVGSKSGEPSTYGPFEDIADPCLTSSVASPDAPLSVILYNIDASKDLTGQDFWEGQLTEMQKNRTFVEAKMAEIVGLMTGDLTLTGKMMTDRHHEINDFDCHKEASTAWHEMCFDLAQNPFALRMVHAIVNLCERGYSAHDFTTAARSVCTHKPVTGIQ